MSVMRTDNRMEATLKYMFKIYNDVLDEGKLNGTYWLPIEAATTDVDPRTDIVFEVFDKSKYLHPGEAAKLIKEFDAREHVKYRIRDDDDYIYHYGLMLKSTFDNDKYGDDIAVPLETFGRLQGCTDIEHYVDGEWKLIIG